MASLLTDIETVPMNAVETHPENPRRGDIDAIAESLQVNGQVAPIVVQRSTNFIISGNHTYMAARDVLNWETIDVAFIDVNDAEARKIMLSLNRSSELGYFDNDSLALLLSSLSDDDDLAGTLYSSADVDVLLATVNTHYEPSTAEASPPPRPQPSGLPQGTGTPVPSVPRTLMFPLSDAEYEEAIAGLRRLQAAREADSLGQVVCDLVAEACENLDSVD